MDAILQRKIKGSKPSKKKAQAFLEQAASAKGKRFASIGHGWDYRLRGDSIIGSALVYRDTVIHAAFFGRNGAKSHEDPGHISSRRRRREYNERRWEE